MPKFWRQILNFLIEISILKLINADISMYDSILNFFSSKIDKFVIFNYNLHVKILKSFSYKN